jgi:hypothetical protein
VIAIVELLIRELTIEDLQPDLLTHHWKLAGITEKAAVYYTPGRLEVELSRDL